MHAKERWHNKPGIQCYNSQYRSTAAPEGASYGSRKASHEPNGLLATERSLVAKKHKPSPLKPEDFLEELIEDAYRKIKK